MPVGSLDLVVRRVAVVQVEPLSWSQRHLLMSNWLICTHCEAALWETKSTKPLQEWPIRKREELDSPHRYSPPLSVSSCSAAWVSLSVKDKIKAFYPQDKKLLSILSLSYILLISSDEGEIWFWRDLTPCLFVTTFPSWQMPGISTAKSNSTPSIVMMLFFQLSLMSRVRGKGSEGCKDLVRHTVLWPKDKPVFWFFHATCSECNSMLQLPKHAQCRSVSQGTDYETCDKHAFEPHSFRYVWNMYFCSFVFWGEFASQAT